MREILDRTPQVLVSLSDAAYFRAQYSHVSIHRSPRFRTWLTRLFHPRIVSKSYQPAILRDNVHGGEIRKRVADHNTTTGEHGRLGGVGGIKLSRDCLKSLD
jgi:hypothetical protein